MKSCVTCDPRSLKLIFLFIVVKPGKCPFNGNVEFDSQNCAMKNDCSSDSDCNGDEKCCKDSCGMIRCRNPAFVDGTYINYSDALSLHEK